MVHKFDKSLVEFGKVKSPNVNFRQCKEHLHCALHHHKMMVESYNGAQTHNFEILDI
jgi:hypothetical protein